MLRTMYQPPIQTVLEPLDALLCAAAAVDLHDRRPHGTT